MTIIESDLSLSELNSAGDLPFEYKFLTSPSDVLGWASEHSRVIQSILNKEGVVLLRGLNVQGSKKLERMLTTLFGDELLEYIYRSTPRTKMRGRIYTSSEYHADETILLHNENAYSNRWPMRIAFCCIKNAQTGGETPICDSTAIYQSIPREIREEFEAKKLRYVRNYSEIDLHWHEVFQTKSKDDVATYCQANGIEFEWLDEEHLRTSQLSNATCTHPIKGNKLWFNQAHLFHISSQPKAVRESLLDVVGLEGLPRNVYYGDGTQIDDEVIAIIRSAYEQHRIVFPWQEGDVLLLDNMQFAHGRQPFTGSRKILTGMSIPFGIEGLN